MWRLNDSGTLVNSYSALCATMVSEAGTSGMFTSMLQYVLKGIETNWISDAVNSTEGIRSWIGTGRKGSSNFNIF